MYQIRISVISKTTNRIKYWNDYTKSVYDLRIKQNVHIVSRYFKNKKYLCKFDFLMLYKSLKKPKTLFQFWDSANLRRLKLIVLYIILETSKKCDF